MDIVVPLPPTPNSVRTAASFMLIVAVALSPSSVLTCDNDIAPDDGNGITVPPILVYNWANKNTLNLAPLY
jgi:hypothetical protein